MAPRAIGAEVGQERFHSELGRNTYQLMRILSQFPQDERFAVTRLCGIGFEQRGREELAYEMGLSVGEFDSLVARALKKLREGRVQWRTSTTSFR